MTQQEATTNAATGDGVECKIVFDTSRPEGSEFRVEIGFQQDLPSAKPAFFFADLRDELDVKVVAAFAKTMNAMRQEGTHNITTILKQPAQRTSCPKHLILNAQSLATSS